MRKLVAAVLIFVTLRIQAQIQWYESVTGFPPQCYALNLAVTPNGDVFLLCQSGSDKTLLFKSSDGGSSWTSVSSISALSGGFAASGSTLFMCVLSTTDGYGLNSSADNGQHWTTLATPIPTNNPIDLVSTSTGQLFALTLEKSPPHVYPRLYTSINNSQTWMQVNIVTNLEDQYPERICQSAGKLFMIASDYNYLTKTLFQSTDGGVNWTAAGAGLPKTMIGPLVTTSSGILICGLENSAVKMFKSTDGGNNFFPVQSSGCEDIKYPFGLEQAPGALVLIGQNQGAPGYNSKIYRSEPPVGTKEFSSERITLCPSPAGSFISLNNGDKSEIISKAEIISVSGQTLKVFTSGFDRMDINELNSGSIYTIKVTCLSGKTICKRFIKGG